MKIHYISCHSVLEYDEVKLFTEMGHDVFANGAYRDPRGAYTLPRPGIPNATFHKDYFDLSAASPKTALPPELIEPFDAIMIMHSPEVLFNNWERIKHKTVIWRTIGQSVAGNEAKIQKLKDEGLKIVRYSPKERNIANYAGEDSLIRFYKDPEEFKDWNGKTKRVINFTQSLLGRRYFCHYDEIMKSTENYERLIYGVGNDDLGALNGGELTYEKTKEAMRDNRCFIYGGTWPASYTLGFIEAWMTGIPVVALGRGLAQTDRFEQFDFYEVNDLIENGVNGFVSSDIAELNQYIGKILNNLPLARQIGKNGREKAISVFGKDAIRKQWEVFFNEQCNK